MAPVATVPMTKLSLYFMLSMLRDDPTMDESVVKKHHWTYTGVEGPEHWPQTYQHCGGKRQSPIDIVSYACQYDPKLTAFRFGNFDALSTQVGLGTNLNFTNNGHAASVRVTGDMYVEGGGLRGRYRTAEFHFHWGSRDDMGSEHAIEGVKYPLEMHIVNYAARYDTLTEAVDQDDGLAVLGVLFQISDRDNPAFEPLAESLQYIHKAGEFQMVGGVRLRSLLPKDTSRFYRYSGSLTTPKCFETVTWTIFDEPQKVSARQLARLRDLLHENGHYSDVTNDPKSGSVGGVHNAHNYLVDNWRPLQPLHSRIITQSFPWGSRRTAHETVTKNAGFAFTSEPALPTRVAVPASTPPPVSTSPLPMPSSSLLVASSPKPEASPMVQLTTTTDAWSSSSPYTYRYTNREAVADPSLEFFTSGNKQGAPPTMPSFKSMTDFNNTKGQNTVLSGAARMMPGNGQQDSLQSTGSKDQLQAVDNKLMEQQPLPVEDHTQTSSTTGLDVSGASAGRQLGLGSGSNTPRSTSVDITSTAQPSSSAGPPALQPLQPQPPSSTDASTTLVASKQHPSTSTAQPSSSAGPPALQPLKPQPPSSTDASTTLVPGEQHPSTAGAPSPPAEESTTRNPSQPFAGVSSPNQDNGQQIATQERGNATSTPTGQSVDTQTSKPVVERVSSPQSASGAHIMNNETVVHNTSETTNQTTTQEKGNATSTHTGQSVDTQASTPVVEQVSSRQSTSGAHRMNNETAEPGVHTTKETTNQTTTQERGNATSTSNGQIVDTQVSTPVVERISSPQSASGAHRMNSETVVHNTSETTNQTTTQERGNTTSTHTGQSVDTQASTPVVATVNIQKLESLLRRMLIEKQRLALNTASSSSSSSSSRSSSSTPLTGRDSTLHPAVDANNQHRAWQQQQRQKQLETREQQIRQQRIHQILLKQRRLMQQQQGPSGARTQQSTRTVYSSTPAGVRRGSIRASPPQPSSNPQTLSQALGSLRSTFYRDATTNHITSGSARVRTLARTINPGAHSVGIRPQLVPAYRRQGERTVRPSVGASRATPYIFLHTNPQTVRILRPFYKNMYQTPRQ